jgi:hypothetical protein
MKKRLLLIVALISFGALAKVSIVEKGMSVKVASIEATVKCVETDDYFDEASYSCKTQAAIKEASNLLGGKVLEVKAMNPISSDVLNNQVDDAGVFKVKLNIVYFN